MWKVPLADLDYDEAEEQAVHEVLRSRWLTMGAVTQAFEEEFKAFTGAKFAIALSNATVALHLACLASDIGPGDEVILPSLSFVATANAVLYTGAQVRFADIISLDELTIDPAAIERLITPRTKAIIVMHYGGYPCRMVEISQIAQQHNLIIIEDAAHAPGAWLDNRHLGTFGEIGCFSFFSNKNLATGEGGMLVTNRSDLADKVTRMRSHGMTSLTWDRHQGHAFSYDVVDLGYNYRIDEIHSALGRQQLKKLPNGNQRRRTITQKYRELLTNCDLHVPFSSVAVNPRVKASCHILPVILPKNVNRNSFMDEMKKSGIQTSIHYPPIHMFSYYQRIVSSPQENSLTFTDQAASREVTFPLYPGMTDEQVEYVVECACKILKTTRIL
jgi:dTDP-4-amino-4,6-dideoxygalactose transaminase